MRAERKTPILIGVLLVAAAAMWAVFVSRPTLQVTASPLDQLESALLDARYQTFGPITPSADVVIVAIDDATLEQTQDRYSDNRLLLAHVIDTIAQAGPKVLGLDVILADAGDREVAEQLAAALARTTSVIAAAGRFADDLTLTDPARPTSILGPNESFARAARVGLVNLSTDAGGVPRYLPVVFQTPQGVEPAFALIVASTFSQTPPAISVDTLTLGGRDIRLDAGLHMPLRLVGPTASIPTYSAKDILSGKIKDALSGKAVILGYTATAFGDHFPNPFDDNIPGVEILATAVSQLLGGVTLRRDASTRRVDAVAGILLALLTTALVLRLPLSTGVPVALGALAAWLGVVWYAFSIGVWLSGSIPVVCATLTILVAASWRYFGEQRSASRGAQALAALKQFQSPVLAEMIANDPQFLKRPTEHALSVFFVDLSSFTGLSEKLGPAGTQDLLKLFHQITAETIEGHDGIVLNYMGDGVLAVFGVACDQDKAADDAMRAAFDLACEIETLGPKLAPGVTVGCRIGLHHGEVMLSRLGGDRHQQVSVAGDTVNLASRLLEVAKQEAAIIAATDVLLRVAGHRPQIAPEAARPVVVRGRESKAMVHFWTAQSINC